MNKIGFTVLSFFFLSLGQLLGSQKLTSPLSKETQEAAKAVNLFSVDLYKQLAGQNNLCFSPYSISSAFAMVYTGAKGNTQREISSVFHFPSSIEELDKGWASLNKFLTFFLSNASEEIKLLTGNSLWIQTNFPVLPAFREMMSTYFNGLFRFVDFKAKTEIARSTINAWVKQNTYGRIADILSPQALDANTRMVLVSALYMKARWQHPFDVHETSQETFFAEDGSTQTTLAMSQTALFPYLKTNEAAILEMPFFSPRKEGPELAMLIILPHKNDGLAELEKNLNAEMLDQWIISLKPSHILVTLPKFKIVESLNLHDVLTKKGMALPFSDQADFSGISGVKGLKIGNVSHKVYLSIDEQGSEAAAATAVEMMATAVAQTPILFQADHPFMYLIFEKTSGVILFIGRYANPHQL